MRKLRDMTWELRHEFRIAAILDLPSLISCSFLQKLVQQFKLSDQSR